MGKTREQKSAAVAEAHYQWVQRNLNAIPFDASMLNGDPDDDYPEHSLTVSASPEQQADLMASLREALAD